MNFSKLSLLVTKHAGDCKNYAAYSGSYGDGGCNEILRKLAKLKNDLVIKYDLRPSEYHKLDYIEVGEPEIFKSIFKEERHRMSQDIKL